MMRIVCPKCHTEYVARGITRSESTFVDRRRSRRYEQSITTPMPQAVPSPRTPPELATGETARYTTPIRAQNLESDVLVPLFQAITSGGCTALVSIPLTLIQAVPWYAPFYVWPVATGAWYFAKSSAAHKLLMLVEEFTGTDIDGDGVVGKWSAESIVKSGQTTTVDAPTLADPRAWHRFCKAVHGGRSFSESESKRHNVPGEDWRTVYDAWVSRGWVVPQGQRKAPLVLAVGMSHIRNYATTPPPDEG